MLKKGEKKLNQVESMHLNANKKQSCECQTIEKCPVVKKNAH